MSKEEFIKIGILLKSAYMSQNFLATDAALSAWYDLIGDLDYQPCWIAAKRVIQTHKFPPSVAEIREAYSEVVNGPSVSYGDAWGDVMMAIRRYGYMREQEALESLDPLTRKAVQNLGYQNLCMSESPETDRANFRMIYEQLSAREKEDNAIAPALKEQIEKIRIAANGQKLLEGA